MLGAEVRAKIKTVSPSSWSLYYTFWGGILYMKYLLGEGRDICAEIYRMREEGHVKIWGRNTVGNM